MLDASTQETTPSSEKSVDIQEAVKLAKEKIKDFRWSGTSITESNQQLDSKDFQGSFEQMVKLLINSDKFFTDKINSTFLSDLLLTYVYNRGLSGYNDRPDIFPAIPPPEWQNSQKWQALLAFTAKNPVTGMVPFINILGANNKNAFNAMLKNGEEKTDFSISQPINFKEIGIIPPNPSKPILSIRQTLGLALTKQ